MTSPRTVRILVAVVSFVLLVNCATIDDLLPTDPSAAERGTSRQEALEAIRQLRYGMTKSEVSATLASSWHSDDCGAISLYLFGSRNPRIAGIVVVRFRVGTNGEMMAYDWGVVSSSDNTYLDNRRHCLSIELPAGKS